MGSAFEKQKELESTYLMRTYGRKPVEFVSGRGTRLFDDEGREYLDLIAGIGSVSMGHCNPRVKKAMEEQVDKLLQVSNYYYIEHRGELAAEISRLLEDNDPDALGYTDEHWRTFFANSGGEANEGALKMARKYGNAKLSGATAVVTAQRSFHGRTIATLFATGQEYKQTPFLPPVVGFPHVPLNDIDALEHALDHPTEGAVAAVMLECIQGEGGVWPCTPEYLQAARRLTSERGMLLIIDEVQTGFYRTGRPFAFQNFGIVPDIVTIAKGMGDGAPIAGFCARGDLGLLLEPGEHGSTFGGNALVCAASYATLCAMREDDIASNVAKVGPYLHDMLASLPHVVQVRGMGLMFGVDLDVERAVDVVSAGLSAGLVLNSTGPHTLRFLPPLVLTREDVDLLANRITPLLSNLS